MAIPPPPDYAAEMEQLRVQLAELRQQQENAQTTNNLLEQLVQKLDGGKKGKIWVDKPERFNGKIGDSVENWLNGWELWFKHREKQHGPEDERTKIETAMQCTTATVRSALARHERENGQWTTWDNFKRYMKAKYTSMYRFRICKVFETQASYTKRRRNGRVILSTLRRACQSPEGGR